MKNKKASGKTLLMSVVMSSPGPIVLGLGLLIGRSATQIADFLRRTSEFLAIVISYIVFRITCDDKDQSRRRRIETRSGIFVGSLMCFCGMIMLIVALSSTNTDKGNVIPSLVIAAISAVSNAVFLSKYTKLSEKTHSSIMKVQARLYRAKTLIDSCVCTVLLLMTLLPTSALAHYLDVIGSVVVAVYLAYSGARTVLEKLVDSSVDL